MKEDVDLAARLESVVFSGDSSDIAEVGAVIDRNVFDNANFSPSLFDKIISIIETERFKGLTDSITIVKIFEYNLDLLTDPQRDKLLAALVECVPAMADSISAFLAVELIAELWLDEKSLKALLSLIENASENTLALTIHGLDWLAKKTGKREVNKLCIEEIRQMTKNSSQIVREEAVSALNRRLKS